MSESGVTDLPATPLATAPAKRSAPLKSLRIRVFAVGKAGCRIMERMDSKKVPGVSFGAVITEPDETLPSGWDVVRLENGHREFVAGGDPERARALAEEQVAKLKGLCEAKDVVFIIAGLGGGTGSGTSPVVARAAKEAGALVLGFVTTPFECEGNWRMRIARNGIAELKRSADGVICLANESMFKVVDESTRLLQAFEATQQLLTEAVYGMWRLLVHRGLMEIRFSDLCEVLKNRHSESTFAVAEASGPTRTADAAAKLLANPMLEGGRVLEQADAVLVSIMSGPEITMADIRLVSRQVGRMCPQAQVILGTAINPDFADQIAMILIATRRQTLEAQEDDDSEGKTEPEKGSRMESGGARVNEAVRRQSFMPPSRQRSQPVKLLQGHLQLQIVNKKHFEGCVPTIHKGEDLDLPTFVRRGIRLN